VLENIKARNALQLLREPDGEGHSLMHWGAKVILKYIYETQYVCVIYACTYV
jgi:hypothetical protein